MRQPHQPSLPNATLQICIAQKTEPLVVVCAYETPAHIDGFSMKIDWDCGGDCEHRLRDLFEYFSERVGSR
jgi:hypothetical protein